MRTALLAILPGLAWAANNTAETGRPSGPGTSAAQDAIPDDLQQLLNRLQMVVDETIASRQGENLAAQLQELRVPDYEKWFLTTFGEEQGKKLASIYAETEGNSASKLVDNLVAHAESGGHFATKLASGGTAPQEGKFSQQIDQAIRQSLKQPKLFYHVSYHWKSKTGQPYVAPFGYMVSVGSSYRLIYKDVIRALPGIPTVRVRQGGAVTAASLIEKVNPVYPAEAREKGIHGTVRLHAVIAGSGHILSLDVLSGDQILVQAALDAVRLWRYKPATIDGEPVEVDTVIDVIFSLNS